MDEWIHAKCWPQDRRAKTSHKDRKQQPTDKIRDGR